MREALWTIDLVWDWDERLRAPKRERMEDAVLEGWGCFDM